jgi:hypothetical protein
MMEYEKSSRISKIQDFSQKPCQAFFTSFSTFLLNSYYISKCEVEGLGWETFRLAIEDVKAAKPRDSEAELKKMRKKIKLKHHWDHLGESGVKISKILKNIETDDYFASLDAWEKYLNESLSLPFDTEISEYQFEGPLREGDKIRVHSILMLDDSFFL